MEYAHEKKSTRKKLFYTLIGFFILLVPLVVAYALGYTLDIPHRSFKQMGGIFLKMNVNSVAIFLDNTTVRETSFLSKGALLSNVDPGVRLVRVEKEGYKPWSKTVSVDASLVTELRYILLIPRFLVYATSTAEEIAILNKPQSPPGQFIIDGRKNLIDTTQQNHVVAPNVRMFQVIGDRIFFIDTNDFIALYNISDLSVRVLGRPGIYINKSRPIRFVQSSEGDVVVMDSSGGVFAINANGEIRLLDTGARDIAFDSEGEKLLMVKERSVHIIWFVDNPRQPFQERYLSETILTLDSLIREAKWYYGDNAHVLVRTAQGVFLSEIDGRGGRNTVEVRTDEIDKILVSPDIPEAIFFQKGKTLYRIDLS